MSKSNNKLPKKYPKVSTEGYNLRTIYVQWYVNSDKPAHLLESYWEVYKEGFEAAERHYTFSPTKKSDK